jgi:hypothetical protein
MVAISSLDLTVYIMICNMCNIISTQQQMSLQTTLQTTEFQYNISMERHRDKKLTAPKLALI